MDVRNDDRGFTIVELLIVVTIASILMAVAFPKLQGTFHQREVNSARDNVLLMSARARARAMENARTVEFHFDRDAGVATVVEGGTTVETLNFEADHGVEATSSLANLVMCYTARGYATVPCSTTLSDPLEITFGRAGHTAALEVWQLGQLRKL